jgi:hypothetical protein
MAVNWIALAHRLAEGARAEIIEDRKRLEEIEVQRTIARNRSLYIANLTTSYVSVKMFQPKFSGLRQTGMKTQSGLTIAKNSVANLARPGVSVLVALVLPPFLTRRLSHDMCAA